MSQPKELIVSCLSTLLLSFFVVGPAQADDPKLNIRHESLAAKYSSQSIPDPIEIEAGTTKTVIIKFKNAGTEIWPTIGQRFVSAYTVEPRDRQSKFYSSNWISPSQTAPIMKFTKPGGMVELALVLKAPDKVGDYTEEFQLAAENYSWIKGGYFFLKIKVVPPPPPPAHASGMAVDSIATSAAVYYPNKFIQSLQAVEAKGAERIKLIVGFQNLGQTAWESYGLVARHPTALALASVSKLTFADELWQDRSLVLEKNSKIEPGGFFREEFFFRAPASVGTYTASFQLRVNGALVEGDEARVNVPVTVTSNAPIDYKDPFAEASREEMVPGTAATSSLPRYRLASEPRLRVGLWRPEDAVQFYSVEDDYDVYNGLIKIGTLFKEQFGFLKREGGQYTFSGGGIEFKTNRYIRLSPVNNPSSVFILWNYERRVKWKGPHNFNQYRGALEYRSGEVKTDDAWAVNDLLFEDYMSGIAENGNASPPEYLKAQAVAQRSYAWAIKQTNKYGIFDVVATTGDQLYLGKRSEELLPNFVAAVKETGGQMVSYEGQIVLTPYFGNTDCRTRAWTEVWGGSVKPWLVSVKANYDCDRGRRMLGHGVGMSQIDASLRAKHEGLSYQDLVKYYYTGVEVERVYE